MKGTKFIKKLIAHILCICIVVCGFNVSGSKDVQAATTMVYFLNTPGWNSVYGYVWMDDGSSPLGNWPGTEMQLASEMGVNWYKVEVPVSSGIHFISNNNNGTQYESYISENSGSVYITAETDKVYMSAKEAETAMGVNSGSSGSGSTGEGDTNPDLDNDVDLSGTGAKLPYVTYEAEDASTNATILEKDTTYLTAMQSEASGRQAVKLKNTGDYVEFTLNEVANAMVIRYSMSDSSDGAGLNADLSLYVNGADNGNLSLTSKYAWIYGGYPYNNSPSNGNGHRFFDESRVLFSQGTLSAGTKIKLQKDFSDTATYYIIDFIECEMVDNALTQPSNSISVTDYGAVADDGNDDYSAFVNCISAAKNAGKEVWIPAGEFTLTQERALEVSDVTIRGAGMWYTILYGAGAAFKYQGTCKFYDFAMTAVSTVRDDSGDLAGFEGVGTAINATIENIWMEHMKVGVWSYNTTNLVIQGCRIRNTYADGINLCSSTNNAVVRNNNLRNTGDDCIAIWPWQGDSCNNIIEYNTVQCPTLANGIAVYGGSGNKVQYNYVADIINNGSGICIGTDYDTSNGFSGTTTVSHNVLVRCGSYHCDYSYPVGAIWIWATKSPMTAEYVIKENTFYDCSYEGVLFDCWNTVTGVAVKNTNIYGATDGIYIRGNTNSSTTLENVGIAEYTGELVKNECNTFTVNYSGNGVYATTMPEPEPPTKDGVILDGFQISTTLGGLRTVYTVEAEINEETVEERGLVYGLSRYIGEDDVYVGSNSAYVRSYAATQAGVYDTSSASETATQYVMTMKQNIGATSGSGLEADYYVCAYAKLSDGTYVYSDVSTFSVYDVADYLYQNTKMANVDSHNYLFDNILSVVNSEYKTVEFDWGTIVVK